MSRTALRVRNPENAPTAWQKRGLLELEKKLAAAQKAPSSAGASAPPIEWHDQTDEGGFRYLRAIPMAPLCATCHGPSESLPPVVKEKLGKLYPKDEATGFSAGELRGAFVVTARE